MQINMKIYKKRLADWVLQEKAKSGSFYTLALAMNRVIEPLTITDSGLHKWGTGRIEQPLSHKSLEKIARYQGRSVEAVRSWLEGTDESVTKNSQSGVKNGDIDPAQFHQIVADYIRTAPVAEVARLAAQAVHRLAEVYSSSTQLEQQPMCIATPLREIIAAELRRKGYEPTDPDSWEALMQKAYLRRGEEVNPFDESSRRVRLQMLMRDGVNTFIDCPEIGIIAVALRNFSGDRRYTQDYLINMIDRFPASLQESGLVADCLGQCLEGQSA